MKITTPPENKNPCPFTELYVGEEAYQRVSGLKKNKPAIIIKIEKDTNLPDSYQFYMGRYLYKNKGGNRYLVIDTKADALSFLKRFLRDYEGYLSPKDATSLRQFYDNHNKSKNKPPPLAKFLEKYTKIRDLEIRCNSHIAIYKRNDKEKFYIVKTEKNATLNESMRSYAETEAANSICYELLLGQQTAKNRTLYNRDGEKVYRIGVISRMIPNFKPLRESLNETGTEAKEKISEENFIKSGMISIWTAQLAEEENDANLSNYGMADGQAKNVDPGQASFSIADKYLQEASQHVTRIDPKIAFKVTTTDIINLPNYTALKPCNGPQEQQLLFDFPLDRLKDNPIAKDQKYYILLKRILIDDSIYTAIAEQTLTCKKRQAQYSRHKIKKTAELRTKLLQTHEFYQFLLKVEDQNTHLLNSIKTDFERFNKAHKTNTKHQSLHIDIELLEKKCQTLLTQAKNFESHASEFEESYDDFFKNLMKELDTYRRSVMEVSLSNSIFRDKFQLKKKRQLVDVITGDLIRLNHYQEFNVLHEKIKVIIDAAIIKNNALEKNKTFPFSKSRLGEILNHSLTKLSVIEKRQISLLKVESPLVLR